MDEEIGDDVSGAAHRFVIPPFASPGRDGVGEDMDVVDQRIGVEKAAGEIMGRIGAVFVLRGQADSVLSGERAIG